MPGDAESPPRPAKRWWLTSLLAAGCVVALTALLIWLPRWPGTILFIAGFVAFIIVMRLNPARWFRRMAGACLGAAAAAAAAPSINLAFEFGEDTFGSAIVDNWPWTVPTFVLASVAFGVLDFLKNRPLSISPSRRTRITASGDKSTAAGGDIVQMGPGGTYHRIEGAADPETLAKIVNRYEATLDEREQQIDQLRQQLNAAFARVQDEAEKGDPEAQAAIKEARRSGDVEKLQEVLITEADRLGDQVRLAAVDYLNLCREIAAIAYLRGDLDEARKRLDAILQLEPADRDAINRLGLIHHTRGELNDAERSYRRVLDLSADDAEGQSVAYGNLGMIYQTCGDLDQAEAMYRKSLEIDEKLGRLAGMASEYGNLGVIYQTRGDLDGAEAMHRKSLKIEQKLGRPEGMANDFSNLGVIYQTRGDLDQAEAMLRKSLEIDEKLGRLEGIANHYANLGGVYKERGDLPTAREHWLKARDLFTRAQMPHKAEKVQRSLDGLPHAARASG